VRVAPKVRRRVSVRICFGRDANRR
jgi:hypothetical protein